MFGRVVEMNGLMMKYCKDFDEMALMVKILPLYLLIELLVVKFLGGFPHFLKL